MRPFIICCLAAIGLGLQGGSDGQDKAAKKDAARVIVLIDAATEGLNDRTKIARIEQSKDSGKNDGGKREISDVRSNGKDQPRLAGIYVEKTCDIVLTEGKTLKNRQVLVAIDVGTQPLEDVRFVERCEGRTHQGTTRFLAYTAEFVPKVK